MVGWFSVAWRKAKQSRRADTKNKNNMNNRQVAHLWASGNKQSAKGSNFYFEGEIIFSYGDHFPIARRVSEDLYLITDRGYSVTTAKHKNYVRRAIPGFAKVYPVENSPRSSFETIRGEKMKQAVGMRDSMEEKSPVKTYQKARELSLFCDDTIQLFNKLAEVDGDFVCFSFNLELLGTKTKALKLIEEHKEAFDAHEIKKQAQREAREEKRRVKWEEQKRILRLSAEEKVKAWREGDKGIGFYSLRILPPMLRIMGDKVETSHGAEVSIDEARKAFDFIGKKIEAGESWARNGETCPVGPFSLVSIDTEAVTVGCHRFSVEEVKAFGVLLNN
jgi:hypothetical protein